MQYLGQGNQYGKRKDNFAAGSDKYNPNKDQYRRMAQQRSYYQDPNKPTSSQYQTTAIRPQTQNDMTAMRNNENKISLAEAINKARDNRQQGNRNTNQQANQQANKATNNNATQGTTIAGPVSLEQLAALANRQVENANLEVMPERFQTPEQLSASVAQIMGMLDPYTKSQQQAAQSAYQQEMQRLKGDWAGRGLLASGAAAAQERQGAANIASQLAAIQAQAQAEAVPLAMQYGQLGMQEAMNRWQQQDANRQFANMQNQQQLQNMSDVWQRQFDVTQFDWQKEEAKLQRALQARGISAQNAQAAASNAIARAQIDMQNKQFALDQALQEASLTGYYNGNPTLAYQNQAWQQLLDIANQTGQLYLPGGIPTTTMPGV